MIKVLVITQDIGKTAPGIVFDKLLYGLSQNLDISLDIIASHYEPSYKINVGEVQIIRYPKLRQRVFEWIISLSKGDIISNYLKKRIKIKETHYDLVLSLVSFHHYFGLLAGSYLKKRLNTKWACYLVDAIPAPNGWYKENIYFRTVKNIVERNLRDVDMIASVSAEMLEYQLSLFKAKNGIIKEVLFPPSPTTEIVKYKKQEHILIKRFLYTGNIYGLRKPDYLIEAFSQLVDERDDVELIFVGNCKNSVEKVLQKYKDRVKNRIKIYPRTDSLTHFMEDSTALIDIDADIENDVFLSSKMSNYLICNRPIICETGFNSPSKHVFSGIPSIIQCTHDPMELKIAMSYVINNFDHFDYNDRNNILKQFSIEYISKKLHACILETIVGD